MIYSGWIKTEHTDGVRRVARWCETVAKEGAWPEAAGQSAPEVIQGEIDCGRDSEREDRREERREGGREGAGVWENENERGRRRDNLRSH
ncbi:hypothetical protein EYF80_004971 [Liparis tanakae]|uniref:Uncharacterized protein n=1 Tax=Liparis tanakae TaxID=230148 RepID=A0A4Z2J406_9TELE|nr:hypothetical protein EYF80_004971 [Liparis tanakae]